VFDCAPREFCCPVHVGMRCEGIEMKKAQLHGFVSFMVVVLAIATVAPLAWADDLLPAYAHDARESDDYETFGPPVEVIVPDGGSYAGIGTVVVGLDDPDNRGVQGIDFMGSSMVLNDGLNNTGSDTTISMAWRTCTRLELDGRVIGGYSWEGTGVTQYHDGSMALSFDSYGLAGDIVNLTVPGIFVLTMEYDPEKLIFDEDQPDWDEAYLDSLNFIYLGWLDQTGEGLDGMDEWKRAVDGNNNTGSKAVENYKGSYEQFKLDHPDFSLVDYLGSYGSDIETHTTWAILDHNSQFASIPEPTTAALLMLGAVGIAIRRHRR